MYYNNPRSFSRDENHYRGAESPRRLVDADPSPAYQTFTQELIQGNSESNVDTYLLLEAFTSLVALLGPKHPDVIQAQLDIVNMIYSTYRPIDMIVNFHPDKWDDSPLEAERVAMDNLRKSPKKTRKFGLPEYDDSDF